MTALHFDAYKRHNILSCNHDLILQVQHAPSFSLRTYVRYQLNIFAQVVPAINSASSAKLMCTCACLVYIRMCLTKHCKIWCNKIFYSHTHSGWLYILPVSLYIRPCMMISASWEFLKVIRVFVTLGVGQNIPAWNLHNNICSHIPTQWDNLWQPRSYVRSIPSRDIVPNKSLWSSLTCDFVLIHMYIRVC